MENNETRDWALDDEKPTELDEAVNFLNSRPHLHKDGHIDRYAVGRIMIEWASQKPETSDEALPIGDVGESYLAIGTLTSGKSFRYVDDAVDMKAFANYINEIYPNFEVDAIIAV